MVSLLASTAVHLGFEPRSGQTKDYKIGLCYFSAKHATLRRKSKYWLARNQINVCATCLPADSCFSELELYKSNSACWSSTRRTSSSSSHWKLTCSRHDIAKKIVELALSTITPKSLKYGITILHVCSRQNGVICIILFNSISPFSAERQWIT